MMQNFIRKIVVLGGGTAGWVSAATLARVFGSSGEVEIELVESEAIGIIGVGEATIPAARTFNTMLGIDEDDFIRKTQATFKLGIEFVNWSRPDARYFHPFGDFGHPMLGTQFHHFWLRSKLSRNGATSATFELEDFNLQAVAARMGRFMRPTLRTNSPLGSIAYAYHLDARLYAAYLRQYSEARGVKRTEGKVALVHQAPETGYVTELELENGTRISGDLFIDCSGLKGILIEETLKSGYEDWRHWLPCDSAVAAPTVSDAPPTPYTRSTARDAGWQWRIPLQHRLGNGLVYSSPFMSREDAHATFERSLPHPPLDTPRDLRFRTGRRRVFWNKNVVSIGLAAGFMEPLESTSIHLAQSGIARLVQYFPRQQIEPALIERYNRLTADEYERIRDFLILHYKATQREDSPFWSYVRNMTIPESLTERWELYRRTGRIYREKDELFSESSWLAVFEGQEAGAEGYDPVADLMPEQRFREQMQQIHAVVNNSANAMPTHEDFIKTNCAASTESIAAMPALED